MKDKSVNGSGAQGAEEAKKEYSLKEVKSFIKKDLVTAIACLQAIANDPDLVDQVAVFIKGRMDNAVNVAKVKEVEDAY